MITHEINQIGRIYYMERLSDAALERNRRRLAHRHASHQQGRASLADRMGDWFISIGMKLKAQQGNPTMGTPLAQR
ncbi:MAG: hypothetical protein WDZ49_17050 [Litorilinea sp.]